MARKTHGKPKFRDLRDFKTQSHLTNDKIAALVGLDRTTVTKLLGGLRFKSLVTPLRIAKLCSVPIESLAPEDAA
jgi:transcriptional regulator with XRE-family HTH domain